MQAHHQLRTLWWTSWEGRKCVGVYWNLLLPYHATLFSSADFVLFTLFYYSYLNLQEENVVTLMGTKCKLISMISHAGFWVYSRLWKVNFMCAQTC
jgi:hypothetical protein